MRLALPSALALSITAAIPAFASPESDAEARDLYVQSDDAYKAGHFDAAADLLQRAYALSHAPVLLYNLARAYEGMGASDKALDAYQSYLTNEPNPPDRGAIEARIETLKRQIDERQRFEQQRDEERKRAEAQARQQAVIVVPTIRQASPVPWVVGGVGLAGVVGGFVVGGLALVRHSDGENAPNALAASNDQGDALGFATAANVAFIAGGVIAGVGIAWGIVDVLTSRRRTRTTATVRLVIGPTSLGVVGSW